MQLLVGLGNPGPKYAGNRHNVGFMAVAQIAHRHNFSAPQKKFHGIISEGVIAGKKMFAFLPMTYMNLSGAPLSEMASFYKIPPAEICVIHDELDLAFSKIRVKQGGGNGGHNGLKSIDTHLGKDYWRMRFGIGHPGDKDLVTGYVLNDFAKEEEALLEQQLGLIAEHIALLIEGDDAGFMNKLAPPPSKKEKENGI